MNKKKCAACEEKKHLDEFNNNKKSEDGKLRICKACVKAENAKFYAKTKKKNANKIKQRTEMREEDKPKKKIHMKRCNYCADKKLLTEFHVNIKGTFKRAPNCKICSNILKRRPLKIKTPEEVQRIKDIMSVPINPKCTQEYYIMQRFTPKATSNLGDICQERRASV